MHIMPPFAAWRYCILHCCHTLLVTVPTSVVVPDLQSDQVSRLVKVHGIIISATAVKAKATKVCLQCRGCRNIINNIPLPPGLQGYALPRKCNVWVPDLDQEQIWSCAGIWVIFILFSLELNRWCHWDTRSHSQERPVAKRHTIGI